MIELQTHPNQNQKRLSNIRQEKGVSNWLTVYPIRDQGQDLKKQQFWDYVCLCYDWRLMNIPSTCSYKSKMDIELAMGCKKGSLQQDIMISLI